jgi:hypothetical protein
MGFFSLFLQGYMMEEMLPSSDEDCSIPKEADLYRLMYYRDGPDPVFQRHLRAILALLVYACWTLGVGQVA